MKSLQGHLLVASPKLADPNFFHAVVLLVQHNAEGALGLVLNRPLDTTIREMWEQVGDGAECSVNGPLHQGGPCEGPLMVVHGEKTAADIRVCKGVYFCTSRPAIENLVTRKDGGVGDDEADEEDGERNTAAERGMKFFVGYAGWTAGQLEAELADSSWMTIDANPQAIFEGDEHLWTDLVRAITRANVTGLVDPKLIPDDPSVN